eukprot:9304394-Pyramimonas_sp.AAC.1
MWHLPFRSPAGVAEKDEGVELGATSKLTRGNTIGTMALQEDPRVAVGWGADLRPSGREEAPEPEGGVRLMVDGRSAAELVAVVICFAA